MPERVKIIDPDWEPMELGPEPELIEPDIIGVRRSSMKMNERGSEKNGIILDVVLPPGCEGAELFITNGELQKLLEFGRWKRVPMEPISSNK